VSGRSAKAPGSLPDFVDYVIELLGPFGTVSARRLFSGHGIFLDGLMFAIVAQETLWLKADEMSREEFERVGCEPFQYDRSGKIATLGFYRAPADALESPSHALPWARTAYAAALRANAKKLAAKERAESSPPVRRGGTRPSKRVAAVRPAKRAIARRPARKTTRRH
jgi:DNA transformation protein and related proteins